MSCAERRPLVPKAVFRAGAVCQSAALLRGARLTGLGVLAAAAAFRDFAAAALCCLTFELNWHRRLGVLGSMRTMGRRPSA